MHYIDKAIEIQRELDKRNITAYELARLKAVNPAIFSNYTRILRLGERVLNQIKKKSMGISKAAQLLRIKGIKNDEYILKIIELDKIKKFTFERFKQLVDNELERG